MPITPLLGKDAVLTGITNTKVRSVSITTDGPQIDATKRGDTLRKYKAGFKSQSVEVETLEDPSVSPGDTVTLTAGHASGAFKVMSVVRNEPLDDVISWNVSLKRTNAASAPSGGGS